MINITHKLFDIGLYPLSLYARRVAGTVVLLFLARYLSVYEYGLFSSYRTIATFWLMFASLGYAEYILVSSNKRVREVQLKISLFVTNAFLVLFLLIFGIICSVAQLKYLFILVAIRQFLDGTFWGLMLPYFQATKKFELISYINIFYSCTTIIIATICYIYHLSLITFLWLGILLGIVNFIQVSLYSKVNYFFPLIYTKKLVKKLDKALFAYIGVCILGYLYTQIPSLYIATFVPKEQAALYFAAYTFANIIFLLLGAQSQKIIPDMMKNSIHNIKKILLRNGVVLSVLNIGIFICFIFLGKLFLKIVYSNPYYIQAYPFLLILTLSNLAFALVIICGTYITASNNQYLKLKMQGETLVLSILMLALLHPFKLYGAAYTYAITAIYLACRYVYTTRQLIQKKEKENVGNYTDLSVSKRK